MKYHSNLFLPTKMCMAGLPMSLYYLQTSNQIKIDAFIHLQWFHASGATFDAPMRELNFIFRLIVF